MRTQGDGGAQGDVSYRYQALINLLPTDTSSDEV